jgi:hypothetical protein
MFEAALSISARSSGALDGRGSPDGVGAANRLHARLREAEVLHRAFLNQLLHGARHILVSVFMTAARA